jgi:hypothetical protein
MMNMMDKIMRISDAHCTATMIHRHPLDLSLHPVECMYGINSVDSTGFPQFEIQEGAATEQ